MGAAETNAAIDALIGRIDDATKAAVRDVTGQVERFSKGFAHVKTGTLRRSILPTPVARVSLHAYAARVGPTVVYGRQKELGGHIYPVRAKALRFFWERKGVFVVTKHVYQSPIPFMKPGTDLARGQARSIVVSHLRDAILTP